jgi:hypothetical protein
MSRAASIAIVCVASAAIAAGARTQNATGADGTTAVKLPPRLESYLTSVVRPSAEDRQKLLGGAPITKLLDGDPSKEVVVFGAIWIAAPVHRYAEALQDIERFESGGGFRVTRRISSPPRLEDFASLHIPEDDLDDLRSCRVGKCEVKLSQAALERFQKEIDWNSANPAAAADALMRQLALDYVNGYLEGGNERLAVYRDGSRPTFVATEFRAMVERMPAMASYMPELRRYLLEYPKATLPGSTSFLYWQDVEFGLKPTIRISHLTIREAPEETVVASKMLYASHYFWTGIELRVLIPDPSRGTGFWFATVSRSRSDGLSGFVGSIIRGRVRGEARDGTLAALTATKTLLERSR